MKAIKRACLAAGFASLLLVAGCGNSPSDVAKAFATSMAEGDIAKAKEYATPRTGALLDMALSLGGDAEEFKDPDYRFVLVEEQVNEDTAKVTTEDAVFDLIKLDGAWKVDVKKDE